MLCVIRGCASPVKHWDLCGKHYQHAHRNRLDAGQLQILLKDECENPACSSPAEHIDHDNSCCHSISGGRRCGNCTRGVLCGRCNSLAWVIESGRKDRRLTAEDPAIVAGVQAYLARW